MIAFSAWFRAAFFALILMPTTGLAAVDAARVASVMQKTVDGFIRPGYRDLAQATAALAKGAADLCDTPSPENIETARARFGDVVARWSRIEIVRTGPVIEGSRFERFLFFPDRKGTGLKQVQAILATSDETATNAARLAGKSVAVQGLGALEFVLFGTDNEALAAPPEAAFRCRYGAAIAANLDRIAQELQAEWDNPGGIGAVWKTSGPDNPVFRTPDEAATALLGIMVHGSEAVRDQRLRSFYAGVSDGKADKGRPKQAIYWRSGQTMASIAGNLDGLKSLFATSDMQSLLPEDSRSIAGSVTFLLTSIETAAKRVDLPVDQALADETSRARLDFMLLNMADLIGRLNLDFGAAIGLGSGFSFADGD